MKKWIKKLTAGLLCIALGMTTIAVQEVYAADNTDMRAVWISTVYSADYPSVTNDADAQKIEFIQKLEQAQELGMNFIRGFSADMEDLTTKKGQKEASDFWKHFCWRVEKNYFEPVFAFPVSLAYHQATVPEVCVPTPDGNVVIVTDVEDHDIQLQNTVHHENSHNLNDIQSFYIYAVIH